MSKMTQSEKKEASLQMLWCANHREVTVHKPVGNNYNMACNEFICGRRCLQARKGNVVLTFGIPHNNLLKCQLEKP